MVSIGAIFGGITLIAGGLITYALYSNRGKITAATSNIIGGIESSSMAIGQKYASAAENIIPSIQPTTLKNPFEVMFGNWMSSMSSLAGSTVVYADDTTVSIPADTTVNPDGTVSGSPPTMDLGEDARRDAEEQFRKNKDQQQSRAGYYYIDQPGKWDQQLFFTASEAEQLSKSPGSYLNFDYLGTQKLGAAGFQTYGISKGYL